MDIKEFSLQLQSVYDEMGKTFSRFQTSSNLTCLKGCSQCCLNPEIEATPLEMIPMALKIYELGLFEIYYEQLKDSEAKACIIKTENGCGLYHERPPICRMFGAAGLLDKHKKLKLSVCKFIKTENEELLKSLNESPPLETPIMSDWVNQVHSLHPDLIKNRQPINKSLKEALERVQTVIDYKVNSIT